MLRTAGWLSAALVLGALGWTSGADLDADARARLVRFLGLLSSAAVGIAVPHVLFPDPRRRMLQLTNPAPVRLLRRQAERWAPVPLALAAAPAGVALRGGVWELAVEAVLTAAVVGAVALLRASGLGPRVRRWEREEGGGWYRSLYERAPPVRFLVPDPLVPGILLTGQVFLAGAVVGVAGQAGGTNAALGAAFAVGAVAAVGVVRLRPTFDRAFWTSNAVWADAFRQADAADAREPIRVDAVYWAPRAIRPTVWAGLVGLDRRFPLGRVAAVLLVLVVAAHLGAMSAGARAASVALYVVATAAAVGWTATEAVMPAARAARVGGAGRWAAARFLMAVRWLPPLLAVGLGLVWLADLPALALVAWAAADLAASAVAAGLATLAARRRAFA